VSLDSGTTTMLAIDGEDPDRDVDVEDPVPGDVLGDDAAEQRPDRERHGRDSGPDPDRLPRSRAANVALMIESVAGIISADPTPCTARARDQARRRWTRGRRRARRR
jgi:hypothetical protein